MKIPVIKKLTENQSIEELEAAERSIIEEKQPEITVEGDDEGEQLTHVIAALEIKRSVEKDGLPLPKALRNYTQRVRKSIS
jgi:hypothetical protein